MLSLRFIFISILSLPLLGCNPTLLSPPPATQEQQELEPSFVKESYAQVKTWTMDNGLEVLFAHDKDLPLVRGALLIRGGSIWEPAEQTGVIAAMGHLLRNGGAGPFSADQLDERLDLLSAQINSDFGAEAGKISFSCLSSDFEEVFEMLSFVALEPRFEERRIDLWKGQAIENIRRRVDDPESMTAIAFNQLLFGDSTYGKVVVEKDVRAATREKIQQAYSRFVHPDRSMLVVAGDIEEMVLKRALAKAFKDWRPIASPLEAPPAVNYQPTPGIYFIEQPLPQATVIMGQQGVSRFSPDFLSISVFNSVFGSGGFGTHLMRRVRSELGLAYSVWGAMITERVKGQNAVQLMTKSQSTAQAIEESIAVLETLRSSPVKQAELSEVKRALEGSFVFNFDDSYKVATRIASLEILGYPSDFDLTYLPGIKQVQSEDVKKVAMSHWDPARFVIVVSGDESAYDSLQEMLEDPPAALAGFSIKKVKFNQKLIF